MNSFEFKKLSNGKIGLTVRKSSGQVVDTTNYGQCNHIDLDVVNCYARESDFEYSQDGLQPIYLLERFIEAQNKAFVKWADENGIEVRARLVPERLLRLLSSDFDRPISWVEIQNMDNPKCKLFAIAISGNTGEDEGGYDGLYSIVEQIVNNVK